MAKTKSPKITVGLPTYGREAVLINTINDIFAQDEQDFEIIVADQTEHLAPEIKHFFNSNTDPRLRYFRIGPPSLPAARNYITDKAESEFLVFIDDDVELPKDFLTKHLQTFKDHPDITAVAGRVKQKGVPFTHTITHFDKYGFQIGWFNCPDAQYPETFPGGNFSIKTEALKNAGGFDPSYRANALREESDCAYRVRQKGYKIFFNPEAYIFHLAAPMGGSRIKVHQFNNLEFYKNDLLFTLKTVRRRYLLVALLRKYGRYTWTTYQQRRKWQTPILFCLRQLYFAVGICVAIKRYFVPLTFKATDLKYEAD
jgi:GT2 family glycosyltransferase